MMVRHYNGYEVSEHSPILDKDYFKAIEEHRTNNFCMNSNNSNNSKPRCHLSLPKRPLVRFEATSAELTFLKDETLLDLSSCR